MLLIALLVRRYLQYEVRLHARVIDLWRPILTKIAIEDGEQPALAAASAQVPAVPDGGVERAARSRARRAVGAPQRRGLEARPGRRRPAPDPFAPHRPAHPRDPHARAPARSFVVEAAAGAARIGQRARVVLRCRGARADRRAARDARHHAPARGTRELARRGDGAPARRCRRRRRARADPRADALARAVESAAAPALACARRCRAWQRGGGRAAAPPSGRCPHRRGGARRRAGPGRPARARTLRGIVRPGSAQEPRRRLRPSRRPRRHGDGDAAHVRQGLVGALSRGPGAAAAERA